MTDATDVPHRNRSNCKWHPDPPTQERAKNRMQRVIDLYVTELHTITEVMALTGLSRASIGKYLACAQIDGNVIAKRRVTKRREQLDKAVKRLYNNGWQQTDIAVELREKPWTIKQSFDRLGISTFYSRQTVRVREQIIKRMFLDEEMDITAVAGYLGLDISTVSRALYRIGVDVKAVKRARTAAKRRLRSSAPQDRLQEVAGHEVIKPAKQGVITTPAGTIITEAANRRRERILKAQAMTKAGASPISIAVAIDVSLPTVFKYLKADVIP